jgi:hypothetical protein
MASMGLAAVAAHKIGGVIPIQPLFWGSIRLGQLWARAGQPAPPKVPELKVLQ